MFVRPLCEDPQFIFNRAAVVPILMEHGYYLNGEWQQLTPHAVQRWIDDFPYHEFNRMLGPDMDWQWLERCFVNDMDGNPVYLFAAVPCGHCALCNKKRIDDFATRCQFESTTSFTSPIMVTLTYNDSHLPMEVKVPRKVAPTIGHPESRIVEKWVPTSLQELQSSDVYQGRESRMVLCLRDVQLFLDRLRHTWRYRHQFPLSFGNAKDSTQKRCADYAAEFPFRYVLVGEYGSHFGRPHYHLIMWNVPYHIKSEFDFAEIDKLKSDIVEVWRKSNYFVENGLYGSHQIQCEVARDCGRYVGKYLGKENPNGRKGFKTASNRGGGIGARFIDSRVEFLRCNPIRNSVGWTDARGRYVEYTLGRYATRRVYPSISAQVPDKCKHFYRAFCSVASEVLRRIVLLGSRQLEDWFWKMATWMSPDPVHLPPLISEVGPIRHRGKIADMTNDEFESYVMDTLCMSDALLEYFGEIRSDLPVVDSSEIERLDALRREHFKYLTRPPVQMAVVEALARKAKVERSAAVALETF